MESIFDDVINTLSRRTNIAKNIVHRAKSYAEKLKNIILKVNKSDYDSLHKGYDTVEQFATDLPGSSRAEGILQTITLLYDRILELDGAIKDIMRVISAELYNNMSIYDMSTTYVINRRNELEEILAQEGKYRDISIQDDEIIFEEFFKKYLPEKRELELFDFIANLKNSNKFTIKIIGRLMTFVGQEKRRKLGVILDQQKDILLGASKIDIHEYKGIQGLLVRYGMAPVTLSLPLEQLFAAAGLKYRQGVSRTENFRQAAENGHGIIILNRSTSSPIEFDLRGLIDMDYIVANNIKTDPMDGLNKKIIRRFGTAKMLPKGQAGPSPMDIFPGKLPSWLIFETINGGGLLRQLGRDGEPVFPAAQFLTGISSRAHQYNDIQARQIMKKCIDDKARGILLAYSTKTIPQSTSIKASIVASLVQNFGNQYDAKPAKNINQLRAIMVDHEAIDQIFLRVMSHATGSLGKGATEYYITYIAKMDTIISIFVKELDRLWSAEKINNRIFAENSVEQLRSILIQIFTNIVTAAIDKLDQSGHLAEYDISLKEYFLERKQAII